LRRYLIFFCFSQKENEVETNTLVRLTTYHELNCIRVVFRFLFTVPFIILGVDGVRPHQHVNDKMFLTDFLAIIAGIGCVVSSGITLVIFFPRSIQNEMALKGQRRTLFGRSRQRTDTNMTMVEAGESGSVTLDVGPPKWTEGEDAAMDTRSIPGMGLSSISMTLPPQSLVGLNRHGQGNGNGNHDADPHASLHEDDEDGYVPAVLPPYEVVAPGPGHGHGRRDRHLQQQKRDPGRYTHGSTVGFPSLVKTRSSSSSPDVVAAVDHRERVRGWKRDVERDLGRDGYGDRDDGSTGSNGSTVVLKPNRLNCAGDVELGEVSMVAAACVAGSVPAMTSSPVSTIATPGFESGSTVAFASMRRRGRGRSGVSNLVHQWRSPIEIGQPTVARWPRQA